MTKVRGGRTLFGHELGILMLNTVFPRPIGDIGNALTWPFPVRFKVVQGATNRRVVQKADGDAELLAEFIAAARELESEGVPAITTSCGFLAIYQRELAAAVKVPVFTSSLLQVPFASRTLRTGKRVGIITMSAEDLTERHFSGVGWSSADIPVAVIGLTDDMHFRKVYLGKLTEADSVVVEEELVGLAQRQRRDFPDIGAYVLECTNMAPYAPAIREATGLPVFDTYTLVMHEYAAVIGREFPEWRD